MAYTFIVLLVHALSAVLDNPCSDWHGKNAVYFKLLSNK